VHGSGDDRREVHEEPRLPGHDERGVRRGLLEVPHPADVRPGLAGEADRRRGGERDAEADQGDLPQVEGPREDLARPLETTSAQRGLRAPLRYDTVTTTLPPGPERCR